MNLPTKITLSRIFVLPVITVFFYVVFPYHYLVAAILFALAALTDMIDGKLARKRNEVTSLGKLLDPISDKILACSVLIMIAANGDAMLYYNPPVGVIAAAIIVAREILIGAMRTVAAGKGVILAADKLGKLKTIFLNVSLPILMIAELHIAVKIAGNVLFLVAFVLTVVSGVNYMICNRHIWRDPENGEKGESDD